MSRGKMAHVHKSFFQVRNLENWFCLYFETVGLLLPFEKKKKRVLIEGTRPHAGSNGIGLRFFRGLDSRCK